jgi:hypothetical protein
MSNDPLLLTRFEALQKKLVPLWQMIGRTDLHGPLEEENTIVVVPSLTLDEELHIAQQQAYEERFLFMLLLLRQPQTRLIYVTSLPVQTSIVDYYLHVLPGVIYSNARRRLCMVSPNDASARPLSRKILDRPRLIQHIRSLIPDLNRAHLVPYNTTDLERELALHLGIPMYAADPRYFAFGTKSGCRRIFAEEGVQHPLGFENLRSPTELCQAISAMRLQKPEIKRVIVKLNEGVSGFGNAVLDLNNTPEGQALPTPGEVNEIDTLLGYLPRLRFEKPTVEYDWYMNRLSEKGGIVEEYITGEVMLSPSAQLRVTPLGEVEQLSTHDQMLGGPSGQTYLGARFPADPAYGPMIMREARKVGQRFASEGIVGRFAIDFVVVRNDKNEWEPYAIEVNLRKGGTTHPFLTLQYLTGGLYNHQDGIFYTALGHPKYYVASDHIASPAYRVFTPDDLFDVVSRYRLHFDHHSQTGVVMHMLSGVGANGLLGATAIADSPAQAEALYQKFMSILDEEAAQAFQT